MTISPEAGTVFREMPSPMGPIVKWNPLPRRTRLHDWQYGAGNARRRQWKWTDVRDLPRLLEEFQQPVWCVNWISAAEAKQRWSTPVGGNKRE